MSFNKRVLGLFSGIGTIEKALMERGYEIVMSCEINKQAKACYEHYTGHKITVEDVRDIGRKVDFPTDIGLLVGGFPCQSLSPAGRSKLLSMGKPADLDHPEKSGLLLEVIRIASTVKPEVMLLENTGSINTKSRETVTLLLGSLGYFVKYGKVNSVHCGPQKRMRSFWVCFRDTSRSASFVFPDRNSIRKYRYYHDMGSVMDPEPDEKYVVTDEMIKKESDAILRRILQRQNTGRGNLGFLKTIIRIYEAQDTIGCTLLAHRERGWQQNPLFRRNKKLYAISPDEAWRYMGFPVNPLAHGLSDAHSFRLLGNGIHYGVANAMVDSLTSCLSEAEPSVMSLEGFC